jgi:hypothetical protein
LAGQRPTVMRGGEGEHLCVGCEGDVNRWARWERGARAEGAPRAQMQVGKRGVGAAKEGRF